MFHRGVMLGNPPWERIKLEEKEFFAARDHDIATAPNKAARQKRIRQLFGSDATTAQSALGQAFVSAKRTADAEGLFVRGSGRFPLTAFGDVNTFALFAENFLKLPKRDGGAGFLMPISIATDATTSQYFGSLINNSRLRSLTGFYEVRQWFPGTDDRKGFAALALGPATDIPPAFAFEVKNTRDLTDNRRRFTLSPDEIALLNPNTHTCPVFRSRADAELTKQIYERIPVLIENNKKGMAANPWGIRFLTMFHMSNDNEDWFRTATQLEAKGLERDSTDWISEDGERWLRLYEAKMVHHYDHRWATDDAEKIGDDARTSSPEEKADPSYAVSPRYWVPGREVSLRTADCRKACSTHCGAATRD